MAARALWALAASATTLAVVACGGGATKPLDGREVAVKAGCTSCHGPNFRGTALAPGFVGLFGSNVQLADGKAVIADQAYLVESIRNPDAKRVKGFGERMPPNSLSDEQVAAIVGFIQSLATTTATTAPPTSR